MNFITSDFKTPWKEVKEKLYGAHWIASLITFIGFLLLIPNHWQQPEAEYIFAFVLNGLLWFTKEMVWGKLEDMSKTRLWLRQIAQWKIFGITPFAWSVPDWKDFRFSIYGSLPFTLLIYILTPKNK